METKQATAECAAILVTHTEVFGKLGKMCIMDIDVEASTYSVHRSYFCRTPREGGGFPRAHTPETRPWILYRYELSKCDPFSCQTVVSYGTDGKPP